MTCGPKGVHIGFLEQECDDNSAPRRRLCLTVTYAQRSGEVLSPPSRALHFLPNWRWYLVWKAVTLRDKASPVTSLHRVPLAQPGSPFFLKKPRAAILKVSGTWAVGGPVATCPSLLPSEGQAAS